MEINGSALGAPIASQPRYWEIGIVQNVTRWSVAYRTTDLNGRNAREHRIADNQVYLDREVRHVGTPLIFAPPRSAEEGGSILRPPYRVIEYGLQTQASFEVEMSDGPRDEWFYQGFGPLDSSLIVRLARSYRFEIFCISRPADSPFSREAIVLSRLEPFDWEYEYEVRYDPWGDTPSNRGDALRWTTSSFMLRPRHSPDGPGPRLDGPHVVEAQSRRFREAGLEPP